MCSAHTCRKPLESSHHLASKKLLGLLSWTRVSLRSLRKIRTGILIGSTIDPGRIPADKIWSPESRLDQRVTFEVSQTSVAFGPAAKNPDFSLVAFEMAEFSLIRSIEASKMKEAANLIRFSIGTSCHLPLSRIRNKLDLSTLQ